MDPISYRGTIDRPWPPSPDGWSACPYDDEVARSRASTLGELPPYSYVDELHASGLYRFFAYESPSGQTTVAAMRYTGTLGTLGHCGGGIREPQFQTTRLDASERQGESLNDAFQRRGVAETLGGYEPSVADRLRGVDLVRRGMNEQLGTELQNYKLDRGADRTAGTLNDEFGYRGGPQGALGQTMTERRAYDHGTAGLTLPPPDPNLFPPDPGQGGASPGGENPPGYDPNPAEPAPGGGTEPIPQDDDSCHWVPDASNSKAVAIAVSISYHNTPVAWTDQTVYETQIDGTTWRFSQWWGDCKGDGGRYKCVSAFRCVPKPGGPPPTPPGAQKGGLGAGAIIGLLTTAGLVIATVAGKGAA